MRKRWRIRAVGPCCVAAGAGEAERGCGAGLQVTTHRIKTTHETELGAVVGKIHIWYQFVQRTTETKELHKQILLPV